MKEIPMAVARDTKKSSSIAKLMLDEKSKPVPLEKYGGGPLKTFPILGKKERNLFKPKELKCFGGPLAGKTIEVASPKLHQRVETKAMISAQHFLGQTRMICRDVAYQVTRRGLKFLEIIPRAYLGEHEV